MDFSNIQDIDKYYRNKFHQDLEYYFKVVEPDKSVVNHKHTAFGNVDCLYKRRDNPHDGSPAIYMGCGTWWSTAQNFLFSGIFAYLFIADCAMRQLCSDKQYYDFLTAISWPYFRQSQPIDTYDIVATLKEASLAPVKAEAQNYIAMLDVVVPYMRSATEEIFTNILDNKTVNAIYTIIDEHIARLYYWVSNTEDEIVSLFGKFDLRKETCPNDKFYPVKYFMLEPFVNVFKKYGICYLKDIRDSDMPEFDSYPRIEFINAPLVLHYADMDFVRKYDTECPYNPEDPFGLLQTPPTEEEERLNELNNTLINCLYDDEPFTQEGKVGLKDCWGRIIVPPEFEDCNSLDTPAVIKNDESCIAVKKDGKWGLVLRSNYKICKTDFQFDYIGMTLHNIIIVGCDGKYGVYTLKGNKILEGADDIYDLQFDATLFYRIGERYAIRLNHNGAHTDLIDEFNFEGEYLGVKIGDLWGYIDYDGHFTQDIANAYLMNFNFELESIIDKD